MVPKGENVSKVKDLELARKRKESSANEAANEDRLRNVGDVASSRYFFLFFIFCFILNFSSMVYRYKQR